jgi:hypothetical protein
MLGWLYGFLWFIDNILMKIRKNVVFCHCRNVFHFALVYMNQCLK